MSLKRIFVDESNTAFPPYSPPPVPQIACPPPPRPGGPDSRLLPEALRSNTNWFQLYESGTLSRSIDQDRRMPVWAIEIPAHIRRNADFGDKPDLRHTTWGLTMSIHIAAACWTWRVWSLELGETPENLKQAKSDFTKQVFRYYTNYAVDAAEPSVVVVNEGEEDSKSFGDWVQVFDMHCTENCKDSSASVEFSSDMLEQCCAASWAIH